MAIAPVLKVLIVDTTVGDNRPRTKPSEFCHFDDSDELKYAMRSSPSARPRKATDQSTAAIAPIGLATGVRTLIPSEVACPSIANAEQASKP